MISIKSDQSAAGENWVGAVGMAIASDQAVAIGVGSLPTPYTDQDSELWFMHQYFAGDFRILSSVGFQAGGMKTFAFDSKAMRKMEIGSTLVIVVENGSAAGVGITYFLNYAVLFQVH